MKAAEVPALLADLSRLGVMLEPDGAGGLRVTVPRSVTSPAEVARRVREAKPHLLAHFARSAEGESGEAEASAPRRPGLPAWQGKAEVYGADALPRKHAPPSGEAPEDRPHVRPEQVCGGCARWKPERPGAEGGGCSAGWAAHGLAPLDGMDLPETSRGSRCWAWGGKGWRKAVRA